MSEEEKICPIMSRDVRVPVPYPEDSSAIWRSLIPCQKEKCKAWVPECPMLIRVKDKRTPECIDDDCLDNDREYLECKGGCRLI